MATPLCRCRVLYLGCAVPKITKDGLQAIQDPLKDIYPDGGAADANGIDAWLSVWSNGLLVEYLDSMGLTVTKFMPVDTLHYCAAVRFVEVNHSVSAASVTSEVVTMRFFPLDSARAAPTNHHHPPLFACIMRRTSGIKVLECHGFICKNEIAANALVKACFHAYSDSMNLRLYTDYAPHMVPVIIPKKKNIFKFGKKSRSKSIGPTLIPVHPVSMRSASPSVNLDPYGYNRVYEWRTPTPGPVFLSSAVPPTPMQLVQPVPAGDYRYANNGIASSLNGDRDNPHRKQAAVWSRSASHSMAGSEYRGDPYRYDSRSPGLLQPRVQSRFSSRGDDLYTDVIPARQRSSRAKSSSSRDLYGSSQQLGSPSLIPSYQAPGGFAAPREQYYEATTVERRKDGGQNARSNHEKSQQVDVEHVSYHRNNANVNKNHLPTPAPYMNELERTLSNGQHLHSNAGDRKLSTFKRYESMPELSHATQVTQQGPQAAQRRRDGDLPVLITGLNLHGSSGSADRTPASTPTSTPALSLSEYYREPRNRQISPPIIPTADYHH